MMLKEQDRHLSRMARKEYAATKDRRAWRTWMMAVIEIAGCIIALALFILLTWMFLAATPDQFSAECEILRAEMETQGK